MIPHIRTEWAGSALARLARGLPSDVAAAIRKGVAESPPPPEDLDIPDGPRRDQPPIPEDEP